MDRRGYFVTAAHCIEEDGVQGDVYLMFSRSKALEVLKKARVVWSGRGPSGDGLDFAVLKIASPLRYVFDWGSLPETDEPVLGVGGSSDPDSAGSSLVALFGGKVHATYDRQRSGDNGRLIRHDSPLRKGNSGGPLINREGQLVAVNYARCWSIQALLRGRQRCSYAARPDVEWLADLIDRDHAALSEKKDRTR